MAWSAVTYVGLLAAILAFALAAAVLAASRTSGNRWLAALLVVEGVLQATVGLTEEYRGLIALEALSLFSIATVPAFALAVLRPLDTPIVGFLRSRLALVGVFALSLTLFSVIGGLMVLDVLGRVTIDELPYAGLLWMGLFLYLATVYVFSLVASISAFRRSKASTVARARARAFVLAFGTRDVGFGGFLLAIVALDFADVSLGRTLDWIPAVATIAYLLLLAYGILRTQLFDIDLKIKVGISKSTVVTLGLVAVLGAAKVAEFYLSKTYGLVAGGIAAGVMLVLAPRLNRIGDKVASAALPRVSDSAEYVASRKVEVYRAAVEVAWEDGNISVQDRAILERLREKLDISPAESHAVETDVVALLRKGAPPAAPA